MREAARETCSFAAPAIQASTVARAPAAATYLQRQQLRLNCADFVS